MTHSRSRSRSRNRAKTRSPHRDFKNGHRGEDRERYRNSKAREMSIVNKLGENGFLNPSRGRDMDRRSHHRDTGHRKKHRNTEEEFMEYRREERDRITLMGAQVIWGKSPLRADEYVDCLF